MTIPIWLCELSEGDVANFNIRFASSTLPIAPDFIGGSNDETPATKSFYVFLGNAEPRRRWLYGGKKIMNERTDITRQFFKEISAKPGTKLSIAMPRSDILVIQKA